jgi:4-aminobutyrate aminotransferase-like enzyme
MGDPHKIILLEAVVKEIKSKNLLAQVNDTGAFILAGLKKIQVRYYIVFHVGACIRIEGVLARNLQSTN